MSNVCPTVRQRLTIIMPNITNETSNESAVCYATGWPRSQNLSITLQNNCDIRTDEVKEIDRYTTAVFFTLHNIRRTCKRITCQTESRRITKQIHVIPSKNYKPYLYILHTK